jgi:single-stranded-DNA-specific exonuclease
MALNDHKSLPAGLCLCDNSWHQGVVGIIASRIKERYHRPVIAFAPTDGGELKGSGRSVSGVHLRDALDAIAAGNPGLLEKFGGHAMAAGLSLRRDALDTFAAAFDAEVVRQLGVDGIKPVITTDGELASGDFTLDLAEQLANAAPWGQQFSEPLFDGVFEIRDRRIVGEGHLRLQLQPADSDLAIPAIAFGAVGEPWTRADGPIHVAFRLAVNEYRGSRSLQLIVEHAIAVAAGN